ncbi:MAG TPA: hypothetical protein VKH18_07925 [Terriglobales bacterium]|nr:hypothetical protein [Terriglobales bacterium]
MTGSIRFFSFLLGLGLAATAGSAQQPAQAALRVFLNEVQPGTMSASQYCTLVFDDHRFHTEKADIKRGRDSDRKVYEGQLSDADWNSLVAIIDAKDFRDLNVPRTVPPLVMQDTHPYTISVARDKDFQSMEFLDNKNLKPYESQVKPLLQWWKSFRGRHTPESSAPPDAKCALDSTHAIFAQ